MKFRLTTDKILKPGVVLLLSACVASIVLSIYQTRKIKESAGWTNHTQQLLLHAEKILTLALDNETGNRGYVISGKKSFLEPLENSQREIYTELAFLKSLTSGDPVNKNLIDSLSFYIDKRTAFSNKVVSAFDLQGRNAAMAMVETGEGKFYTDQVRLYVNQIQAREHVLLSNQIKVNDELSDSLINTLLTLAIAVLVIIVILLFLIRSWFTSLRRLNNKTEREVYIKTNELHTVLERITDAFVALDKNWCYTYMNKKAGELTGRDPDKVIGKNIWTELPESAGQPFQKAYEKAMAEQKYIYLEEYFPPFDKWFENHIYPSPDGLSIFFRDISEKKKTEEELGQSEKRFRALVENNEGIISLVDEKLNVLFRSASAARITGWTNEEFAKTNAAEYIHPDDLEGLKSAMTKAMENAGENIPIEIRVRHKNGHYIWLEGGIRNMMNDPAIGGIITNMRDITESKKAKEELNQNHAFIESIINASPDIIYIYDIEERKNIYVNEGIQRNLGYTAAEIKQMDNQIVPMLMHPGDFDFYLNSTYPKYFIAADKEIVSHEYRMKDKSGNWHWFLSKESIFLRKADGTPKQIFGITTDITENKKVEEALKSSNFSLSEAQRIAKMGSWTYFLNGGELKWSDNMYQLYGLSSKVTATTPEFFFELVHPDDREKMQRWMQACLAGEAPDEYEFRSILPDGSIHYYSGSGEMKYDKENTPVYMQGTVQDITDRKKAEEKLIKSEELFSGAFHASPAGILITRIADGKIINANESFLHMFEFSAEEAIGRTSIELNMLSPDERAKLIQQQIASGGLNNFELLSKTKSGKPINLLFSSKELKVNDELCHITTLIDITGRKKAEEELLLNKERFSIIFEKAPYAASLTKGNTGKIEEVNAAFERLFGYTKQEVAGKTSKELQFYENMQEREKMAAQFLEKGFLHNVEEKFLTRKGEVRSLLVNSDIVDIGGQKYILSIAEDITEKKKTEDEIKNTAKRLRELTAHLQTIREEERKRIGREIHDELGQQLTAIKMDVAWIDKKISASMPGAAEPALIKNKLQNVMTLLDGSNESVRKILQDLRHGILEDGGLLEAMEWQGNQFTEISGIPVQFITSETKVALPEHIANSLFRLYQEALTNITRHAQATKVTTSLRVKEGNIILLVEDDGKGFDIKTLEQSKSFGILGMKERVLSLHGQFELVSEKGKGTQIEITIPLKH